MTDEEQILELAEQEKLLTELQEIVRLHTTLAALPLPRDLRLLLNQAGRDLLATVEMWQRCNSDQILDADFITEEIN